MYTVLCRLHQLLKRVAAATKNSKHQWDDCPNSYNALFSFLRGMLIGDMEFDCTNEEANGVLWKFCHHTWTYSQFAACERISYSTVIERLETLIAETLVAETAAE